MFGAQALKDCGSARCEALHRDVVFSGGASVRRMGCRDTKRGCGTDPLKIEPVSATAGYDESLGGPLVVIKAGPRRTTVRLAFACRRARASRGRRLAPRRRHHGAVLENSSDLPGRRPHEIDAIVRIRVAKFRDTRTPIGWHRPNF